MYLTRIKEQKEARAQVKRLHPSTKFLFGGHVKELSQDIKAAEELDPLAPPPKKFFRGNQVAQRGGSSGSGGSFTRYNKGRGGSNLGRGGKKFPSRGINKLKE